MKESIVTFVVIALLLAFPAMSLTPGHSSRQIVKVRTKPLTMLVSVRNVVDFGSVEVNTNVCSNRDDVEIKTPGSGILTVKITDLDTTRGGNQLNYSDLNGAISELWLQESTTDTSRDYNDITLIGSGEVPGILPQPIDASRVTSYEICIKTGNVYDAYDSIELTYQLS